MAYADYSFYLDVYKPLSAMPEAEFEARAQRASETLDYFTLGRAGKAVASGDAAAVSVQKAVCAMAEAARESGGSGVAASVSFTTDGYSESRSYGAGKSEEALLYDTARIYLQGTGLLARIVRCRPCC